MALRGASVAMKSRLRGLSSSGSPGSSIANEKLRNTCNSSAFFSRSAYQASSSSALSAGAIPRHYRCLAFNTEPRKSASSSTSNSRSSSSSRSSERNDLAASNCFCCVSGRASIPRAAAPSFSRRPFSTRSEDGDGKLPTSTTTATTTATTSEEIKIGVHVTHVDAASNKTAAAGGHKGGGDDRTMLPEEENGKPLGEAAAAGEEEEGDQSEPPTMRFLDVPGSAQTREEKMTIVFTCTVCDTRTAKTFAKLSYEKGVVLARCPGCNNLHLIADRLGWFEEAGDESGGWDIEKITNRIGESECHVVNDNNVMELNLVDVAGKGAGVSTATAEGNREEGGRDGSGVSPSPRGGGD